MAMTDIMEMLRLRHECGLSQRDVARASGCSLGTVNQVLRAAASAGLGVRCPKKLLREEEGSSTGDSGAEPTPQPDQEDAAASTAGAHYLEL